MKNGTQYAARLKKAYGRLRQSVEPPTVPETIDPVRQLAIAILGVDATGKSAEAALDRLLGVMVDWNEVRVSNALEVTAAIGNVLPPNPAKCQRLLTALQSIYRLENRVSLDRLKSLGRREVRQYLEKLSGVDEFATASVFLWSFGGHAVPVNDALLAALREAELVHPSADRAEVQAFLERNISASEAREFCLVMEQFRAPSKPSKKSATKPKAKPRKKETA